MTNTTKLSTSVSVREILAHYDVYTLEPSYELLNEVKGLAYGLSLVDLDLYGTYKDISKIYFYTVFNEQAAELEANLKAHVSSIRGHIKWQGIRDFVDGIKTECEAVKYYYDDYNDNRHYKFLDVAKALQFGKDDGDEMLERIHEDLDYNQLLGDRYDVADIVRIVFNNKDAQQELQEVIDDEISDFHAIATIFAEFFEACQEHLAEVVSDLEILWDDIEQALKEQDEQSNEA